MVCEDTFVFEKMWSQASRTRKENGSDSPGAATSLRKCPRRMLEKLRTLCACIFHYRCRVSCFLLLLAASVLSFTLGIGIYVGSLAFADLDDSHHARNKKVFVVYCATTAVGFSLYIQSSLVQWSQKAFDQGDKIMEDLTARRRRILQMLGLRSNTDYLKFYATHANYPSMPTMLTAGTAQHPPASNQNTQRGDHKAAQKR